MKATSVLFILFSLIIYIPNSNAATCTFTGAVNSNWSNAANWDCGSVPDPSSDDIIIPAGETVVNDGGSDFAFSGGFDLTIDGSLNMQTGKIELTDPNSLLTIGGTGALTNVGEFIFVSGSRGQFALGATIEVAHLKTDDNSELLVNNRCLEVSSKMEVLGTSRIVGTGCITYSGSAGDFTNSSTGGIFGSTTATSSSDLDGAALPIELLLFHLEYHPEGVRIEWATATETNNDFFSIERSQDGNEWGVIHSLEGAGDSDSILSYYFMDVNPITGIAYYRLKQTDFDGQFSYSQIASIDYYAKQSFSRVELYPNPGTNILRILANPSILGSVAVRDMTGRQVSVEVKERSGTHLVLDISKLPKGVFMVNTSSSSQKFIKY